MMFTVALLPSTDVRAPSRGGALALRLALLLGAVGSPAVARAAPAADETRELAADAEKALADGERTAKGGYHEEAVRHYLGAAEKFARLAELIPADDPYREVKQADRISQAYFAYERAGAAHQKAHNKRLEGERALGISSKLRALVADVLSRTKSGSDQHAQLSATQAKLNAEVERQRQVETQRELDKQAEQRVKEQKKELEREREEEELARQEAELARQREAEQQEAERQRQQEALERERAADERRAKRLSAGLWTSVGLAVAGGATAGGLLVAARTGGSVHADIVEAAAADPSYDPSSADLCATPSAAVESACGKHSSMVAASYAMLGVAGVGVIGTVTFAVLLSRHKRATKSRDRAGAPRLDTIGVGPLREGAMVGASLRF